MFEIQQPKFFVPMSLLVLVRRVFPRLAWAADIGWCWLACSGRGQGLAWGVELLLEFEYSATAHIKINTTLLLPHISSLYAVLPDYNHVWVSPT